MSSTTAKESQGLVKTFQIPTSAAFIKTSAGLVFITPGNPKSNENQKLHENREMISDFEVGSLASSPPQNLITNVKILCLYKNKTPTIHRHILRLQFAYNRRLIENLPPPW